MEKVEIIIQLPKSLYKEVCRHGFYPSVLDAWADKLGIIIANGKVIQHGRWINIHNNKGDCSVCGEKDLPVWMNYCPICGANMKEEIQ